jgi:hypothetical protein
MLFYKNSAGANTYMHIHTHHGCLLIFRGGTMLQVLICATCFPYGILYTATHYGLDSLGFKPWWR